MATFYTFDLDNGAQMHCGSHAVIECQSTAAKSPDQVQVGDVISHAVGAFATVTNVSTQEI